MSNLKIDIDFDFLEEEDTEETNHAKNKNTNNSLLDLTEIDDSLKHKKKSHKKLNNNNKDSQSLNSKKKSKNSIDIVKLLGKGAAIEDLSFHHKEGTITIKIQYNPDEVLDEKKIKNYFFDKFKELIWPE